MARLRLVLVFALSLLLLPQVASAQSWARGWSRVAFNVGGGVSVPAGTTSDRLTPGWDFNVGGGYRFDRHWSAGLDFNLDRWKLNAAALREFEVPAGHTTVWSLTFNPTYNFNPRGRVDVFTTAGYGLYHRNLVFTQPVRENIITCDPFFGFCFNQTETVNQVLAQFGVYKGGFNAGGGLAFRLGESNLKFYMEARYHQMFNSGTDMKFVPVTLGLRW
jgi:opacity protein-like surface antigen